jgi:hypothetical protein
MGNAHRIFEGRHFGRWKERRVPLRQVLGKCVAKTEVKV